MRIFNRGPFYVCIYLIKLEDFEHKSLQKCSQITIIPWTMVEGGGLIFKNRGDVVYGCSLIRIRLFVCLFCFDLGFHTRNPVIKYRPDASCMSYMEARAEMP